MQESNHYTRVEPLYKNEIHNTIMIRGILNYVHFTRVNYMIQESTTSYTKNILCKSQIYYTRITFIIQRSNRLCINDIYYNTQNIYGIPQATH